MMDVQLREPENMRISKNSEDTDEFVDVLSMNDGAKGLEEPKSLKEPKTDLKWDQPETKCLNITLVDSNGIEIKKLVSGGGFRPTAKILGQPQSKSHLFRPKFIPQSESRKRTSPSRNDGVVEKKVCLGDVSEVSSDKKLSGKNGRHTPVDNLSLLASAALEVSSDSPVSVKSEAKSNKDGVVTAVPGVYVPRKCHYDPLLLLKSRLNHYKRAQQYLKKCDKIKGFDIRPRFFELPTVQLGQVDVCDKITRAVELLDVKQRKEYTRTKDIESERFIDEGTARRVESLRRHRERKQAMLDEKDNLLGYLAAICKAQHDFITQIDQFVKDLPNNS